MTVTRSPSAGRQQSCRPPHAQGSVARGGAHRAPDRRACPSRKCRTADADQRLTFARQRGRARPVGQNFGICQNQCLHFAVYPPSTIKNLPSDITRSLRAEKQQRPVEIICQPIAPDAGLGRMMRRNLGVCKDRRGQLSRKEPRRNGVGIDSSGRPCLGHRPRHLFHTAFARAISNSVPERAASIVARRN